MGRLGTPLLPTVPTADAIHGGHHAPRREVREILLSRPAPLSALDGVAPAVGGGRLLPRLCHRPDSAALAGRLRPSPERSTAPSTAAPRGRSCATLSAPAWTATPPPDGSSSWPPLPGSACRR